MPRESEHGEVADISVSELHPTPSSFGTPLLQSTLKVQFGHYTS